VPRLETEKVLTIISKGAAERVGKVPTDTNANAHDNSRAHTDPKTTC